MFFVGRSRVLEVNRILRTICPIATDPTLRGVNVVGILQASVISTPASAHVKVRRRSWPSIW